MGEPVPNGELSKFKSPQWITLDDGSYKVAQIEARKSLNRSDYLVSKKVILYPSIDGKPDPLAKVHYDLLSAVSNREADRNGLGTGLATGLFNAEANIKMIYFAVPRDRRELLDVRDAIITETNNMIATLNGNKFVPTRV
ncbi:MAG: hypothetical protein AAB778_03140 [Patescibacteria group bacterium]